MKTVPDGNSQRGSPSSNIGNLASGRVTHVVAAEQPVLFVVDDPSLAGKLGWPTIGASLVEE